MRTLCCWLGFTDMRKAEEDNRDQPGPIAAALLAREFDELVLINDRKKSESASYRAWLKELTDVPVREQRCTLSSPMNFGQIYQAAVAAATDTLARDSDASLTFHLSPGTSAMASVWIILSQTKFSAALIQSSIQAGVEDVHVPFEIAADFIPDLYREGDRAIAELSAGLPPPSPAFEQITHRSAVMKRTIGLARRFAARSVRVLIEGESGTGKELLARAIHDGSLRRDKQMVVVNCGAIPENLVEGLLFGHKKGAFTGADTDKPGLFEAAHESTLFLDEIGELPLASQVKLLRVLQEGKVMRLGDSVERPIDVRIIAATNRTLAQEVRERRFREDLFYRLAEVVLTLPPLRERGEDLKLLTDALLTLVNERFESDPGYEAKSITVGARKRLKAHHWPGNVRELQNVLTRAALSSTSQAIGADDIEQSLFSIATNPDGILGRPLDLVINSVIDEVKRHYVERAHEEAGGNKTKGAELLGLSSYKVFGDWADKLGVG